MNERMNKQESLVNDSEEWTPLSEPLYTELILYTVPEPSSDF